jgi:glutathione peroxidase-family protein
MELFDIKVLDRKGNVLKRFEPTEDMSKVEKEIKIVLGE